MTDLAGGIFQGVGTLTSGILNYKLGKQQLKVAKEQLQEQKAMNEWEKQKYNTTLNNQKSGIATLGKAFGEIESHKTQAPNPNLNATSPATNNANQTAPATPRGDTSKEKELPTQRM
ncbi:hypothetical protein [Helicobacter himalayensis]|uniref:hypothetical protein n=1 Tax=Helicobacter himalayensis TaxID=1591088 RepID=UPI00082C9BE1|nr:hypothetical protein [Helicobacter himalayensis]